MTVPWRDIDTLFLDAGNTLVSIDFPRVADALAELGVETDVESLRRAEARGRLVIDERIRRVRKTEGDDSFLAYLGAVLGQLAPAASRAEALAPELAPKIRVPGDSSRLWRWVLPGVPAALDGLRGLGLRLVVVSNSDGTIAGGLAREGLGDFFDDVVDSQVVGHEKPDPGIFRVALERNGADPARTAHIGDLYAADVVGARDAGVHPVLLDPYGDWQVDCETVADLSALLERIRGARA